MFGFEVFLTMIVTRILLPVSVLLLVGEWVHRREQPTWKRS